MSDVFMLQLIDLDTIDLQLGVVPVLVGPLQALIAILPGLLLALGGMLLSLFKPRVVLLLFKILWRQKLAFSIMILLVYAVWTYLPKVFPDHTGPIAAVEANAGSWDMFRGSSLRTGRSGTGGDPAHAALNWAFDSVAQTFYSTPTILGNRLYVTSVENIGPFNLNGDGAIYCLDADTGGIVWKQQPSGYRATFSSPSVSGKYLVVGEGLHLCSDARIYCLDIENQGKILWEYKTKSHVESSPCIFDDKVYIGAGDDGYYCFQLEPDADGEPQMVWHVDGEAYLDAETSPLVIALQDEAGQTTKRFYAGLGMGGKEVLCLNAETGDVIWKKPAPYPVFGPPSFKDGRVYVGMGNGNFAEDAELAREAHRNKLTERGLSKDEIQEHLKDMQPGGSVWCIDALTGERIWEKPVGRTVLGAVIPGEEGLYYASRDGHLYLCSYDGKEIEKFACNEAIVASPALGLEHIYCVTMSGNLFCLSSDNLELAWKSSLGQGSLFISSPSLARDHVYVGTDSSGLLCLGTAETNAVYNWSSALGSAGNTGFAEASTLPERGKYAWKYPGKGDSVAVEDISVSAPAAVMGGTLIVPLAGTVTDSPVKPAVKGLLALDIGNDEDAYRTAGDLRWQLETELGCYYSPVVTEDRTFVVDGKVGEARRHLYCVDTKTGAQRWRSELAKDVSGNLLLGNEQLFYENEYASLSCVDFAGEQLWAADYKLKALTGSPALHASLIVVSGIDQNDQAQVLVCDRMTGQEVWRKPLGLQGSPLIHGTLFYAGTASGISAFRLIDGSCLWSTDTGGPAMGEIAVYKKKIAYVNKRKQLLLIDQDNGAVLKTIENVYNSGSPLFCREGLVFSGETDLMIYDFNKDEVRTWVKSKWLGHISNPLIMAHSRAYFVTDKKGIVCVKEK